MKQTEKNAALACPCGAGAYATCCARYHDGVVPDTAEQLMRARYSAYALGHMSFVHDTWHPTTRPTPDQLQHDAATKWMGLEVRNHLTTQDQATVEFVARYKTEGRAHRLHEVSRFVREDGHWFYVDGSFPER